MYGLSCKCNVRTATSLNTIKFKVGDILSIGLFISLKANWNIKENIVVNRFDQYVMGLEQFCDNVILNMQTAALRSFDEEFSLFRS